MSSPFHYGRASMANLAGIHPDMYAIAMLAITLSPIDYSITDGTRTRKEQRANVRKGVSKTMRSRHLRSLVKRWRAKFGHAIDFVPYIDGKADWDNIEAMKVIIEAFFHAAEILQIDGLQSGGRLWNWDWYHLQFSRKTHR